MKIEWLVATATAAGSPDRVEHDILGMILEVFRPGQAAFVAGKPLCDVRLEPYYLHGGHSMKIE